jgi:hypothetical protein
MMELGAKTRRQSRDRDLGSWTGACGGGSRTGAEAYGEAVVDVHTTYIWYSRDKETGLALMWL